MRATREYQNNNFLMHGNGILLCYNMFPRQFKDLQEMRTYLSKVKEMGFNAVWLNPIQVPGGPDPAHPSSKEPMRKRDKNNGVRVGNEVSSSLYAMHEPDKIDPRYLGTESNQAVAIRAFTDEARRLGLVPMFDLVLNHVAADSPICKARPDWFEKEPHPDFKDARAFDYTTPGNIEMIFEEFWKPYLERYIEIYGFDGVRVDAVGYLPRELRQRVYNYIKQTGAQYEINPVILDEALFADDITTMVGKLRLDGTGPSNITTGVYYASREPSGGLPQWTKSEEGEKQKVVFQDRSGHIKPGIKGGCINFSGNHDHNSLAMMVLYEMAHERMARDPRMQDQFQHVARTWDPRKNNNQGAQVLDEAREAIFLYSYVQDIKKEITSGNSNTKSEFRQRMHDHIARGALVSSGGWYALSGDEYGDPTAKPVFLRANGSEFYPQKKNIMFTDTFYNPTSEIYLKLNKGHYEREKVMRALKAMALADLKKDLASSAENQHLHNPHQGIQGVYHSFHDRPDLQERMLAAYIENIENQLNSGHRLFEFADYLEAESLPASPIFYSGPECVQPRNIETHWIPLHDASSFMRDINKLLAEMPESKSGYWSELIALPNDDRELVIVVRKNGLGYGSPTDIAIICKDPSKQIIINDDDLHKIAIEFQKRGFPTGGDASRPDTEYSKAYLCVMERSAIHVGSNIILTGQPQRLAARPQILPPSAVQAEDMRASVREESAIISSPAIAAATTQTETAVQQPTTTVTHTHE